MITDNPYAGPVVFDAITGTPLGSDIRIFSPAVTPESAVKLTDPMEAEFEANVTGFEVVDDVAADRMVRAIKEEESTRDRIIAIAEAKKAELEGLIEYYRNRCEGKNKYRREVLKRYFDTVERRETKTTEKYELLSGTLVLKKPRTTMKVINDSQLVEWLEASGRGDFVKVEKKPRWGDLKKVLTCENGIVTDLETGEVVNGVDIEEQPESFAVK